MTTESTSHDAESSPSMVRRATALCGRVLRQAGQKLERWAVPRHDRFHVFLDERARALNRARLQHLDSLQLDLTGKRVLEVGAGIGLLTAWFERQGCSVLVTDGRSDNVAEIGRRFPYRDTRQLDLDKEQALTGLGPFDVAFVYGTLYHLSEPEQALRMLAGTASLLLLETCVTPGSHSDVHLVKETSSANQALAQIGCRPTRPWILERLRSFWGHAYVTVQQPDHPDFETDWACPFKHGNHRAVFVASHTPLNVPTLTETLTARQSRCTSQPNASW